MYGSMNNNQGFSMLGRTPSGNLLPGSQASREANQMFVAQGNQETEDRLAGERKNQRRIAQERKQETEDRLARQDLRGKLLRIMEANISKRRGRGRYRLFGNQGFSARNRSRLAELVPQGASLEMLQNMYDREVQNSMNMASKGFGLSYVSPRHVNVIQK